MEQYLILIIWILLFSYVCWRNLIIGACVIVFFLPAYLLRPDIFGIPTTILELEIYAIFCVWVLKNRRKMIDLKAFFQNKVFFAATTIFFLGVIVSTALSLDTRVSLGILKGWFFDPFLFCLVLFFIVKTKGQIEKILFSLLASGIFVAVVGLIYKLFGVLTYDGRLRAFFLSPNHLAMFLCPCFLASFYFLAGTHDKKRKIFLLFSIFLIGLAIYLTYSYGAWIGVVGSLGVWSLFSLQKRARILGFIGIAVLIVFLIFFQLDSQKFKNLIESPRSPLQSRIMVWQSALKIAADNFVFGIGPGMFQKQYLDYQKYFIPYLEWAVPQPHNIFLAFLVQNGILGLAGFLMIVFLFFNNGIKNLQSNREQKVLLMVVMSYFLIHGLVDTTYWKNDLSVVFWMLISFMLVFEKKDF